MLAVSISALLAAFGAGVAHLVLRRHGWAWPASAVHAVVMGPGLGLGLASLAFFFWVFAGLHRPGRWVLIAGILALAALVVAPVHARLTSGATARWPWPRPSWAGYGALALAAVSLLLVLVSFQPARIAQPFGYFDATAIWNARSLFLYRAEGNLWEIYSGLRFGHPDYPLLLPASLAAQYCLYGGEHLAIPQATGLLFSLAVGASLFLAVARVASLPAAAAATALLWTTPSFWRWGFSQYADLPLAYLLLLATMALGSQLAEREEQRLPATLTGLCLGLLTWIKNEGLVLTVILAGSFAAVVLFTRGWSRTLLRRLSWIAVGAAPVLLALALFKTFWSPVNETGMFLEDALRKILDVERWRVVAKAFFQEMNPWTGASGWGVLWVFAGACGVVTWRGRRRCGRPLVFLEIVVLSAWAAWFTVYLCTPATLEWHLGSSLKRLMLQLAPLTLYWALAGAGSAEERLA